MFHPIQVLVYPCSIQRAHRRAWNISGLGRKATWEFLQEFVKIDRDSGFATFVQIPMQYKPCCRSDPRGSDLLY